MMMTCLCFLVGLAFSAGVRRTETGARVKGAEATDTSAPSGSIKLKVYPGTKNEARVLTDREVCGPFNGKLACVKTQQRTALGGSGVLTVQPADGGCYKVQSADGKFCGHQSSGLTSCMLSEDEAGKFRFAQSPNFTGAMNLQDCESNKYAFLTHDGYVRLNRAYAAQSTASGVRVAHFVKLPFLLKVSADSSQAVDVTAIKYAANTSVVSQLARGPPGTVQVTVNMHVEAIQVYVHPGSKNEGAWYAKNASCGILSNSFVNCGFENEAPPPLMIRRVPEPEGCIQMFTTTGWCGLAPNGLLSCTLAEYDAGSFKFLPSPTESPAQVLYDCDNGKYASITHDAYIRLNRIRIDTKTSLFDGWPYGL